jgi:hypothetical protein
MWSVVHLCMRRLGLAMVALATGCGDSAARIQVVALGGACARPAQGNLVKVTAYSPSGDHSQSLGLDQTLEINDFPADTEQLAIEVVIAGGGIGAAGKSPPLMYGRLPDGATIPIAMAPPAGFCELPPMKTARAHPLVATAGNGALVVGGIGDSGALSTAEYYDAATQEFVDIAVPSALVDEQGFTGAALATLPDGLLVAGNGAARDVDPSHIWLARVSPAGKLVREHALDGGSSAWRARAVAALPDGFAIAGDVTAPGGQRTPQVWWLTTDGETRLQRAYGDGDLVTGLAATRDGGLVLVGSTTHGPGKTNVWVVRLDPKGDVVWQRVFGAPAS